MPMDLFTPETMDGVVRVMPTVNTFFRDTFFRTNKPEYTEKVRVDFVKGTRKVAPFINMKKGGKVVEKRGYLTDEFTTPIVSVMDVTNIEDMLRRLPGELLQNSGTTPYERGIQLMADQFMTFEDMIARREEWMCVQSMMEGKIPVIGDNVSYEIDFGFTNKATVSVPWAQEGATPYHDLQAASIACRKKGYRTPNIMIMGRDAWTSFLASTKQDEFYKQMPEVFDIMSVKPERRTDAVTYMGRLRDPDLDLYVYDEWIIDDWTDPENPTEVSLMPANKVLLASTAAKYTTYYGLQMFTDPKTGNFRQVIGTRAADSWVQKNPDARFLTLSARPLPVPHEVDSWYVLTV